MLTIRAAWDRARSALAAPAALRDRLGPTLGDLAVGRDNNLNLLRFVAASMVLFFHCFALTGHQISELPVPMTIGFMDLGLPGVAIFFSISGFLIAQSVLRSRSGIAFVKARALRILPALALSTLFSVLVIGPIATTLPQAEYWSNAGTWRYLFHTVVLDLQVSLPGVFQHNPYLPAINGSLWTIPVEVWCYGVMGVAAVIGLCARRWRFNIAAIAALVVFANYEMVIRSYIPSGPAWSTPHLVGAFFFGAWCFLHRALLPASLVAAAAAAIAAIAMLNTPLARYALLGAVTYLTLIIAYNPGLRVDWFLKLGDYSYGIYVFAFPVQQFLVWWLKITSPLVLFALAFPATLALAILSWHLVERPALALKR